MFELIPFGHHMTSADPFRAFDELQRSFFNNDSQLSFRTDVQDLGDAYLLEAELPGYKKEEIQLDLDKDCLTISAQRNQESEEKKANYIKRERSYGSYSRSFDMTGIDQDKIEASYTDGILSLRLPKLVETVNPARRLEIR